MLASSNHHRTIGGNGSQTSSTSKESVSEAQSADKKSYCEPRSAGTPPRQRPPVEGAERKTVHENKKRQSVSAAGFDTATSCLECGTESFARSESGEWYCESCGVVHSNAEIEFTEPGWRPADQRRTGPASSVTRLSIGTVIGEKSCSSPSWTKYNNRLDHSQETLRHGLSEVRAVSVALETTAKVTERSAFLFRQAADKGILVGQSIEAVAAACVHAAAREELIPFPLKEIAEVSPVGSNEIRTAFSKLLRELGLKIAPPSPTDFVPRFVSEAGLSIEVRKKATEITEKLVEMGVHVGQSPTGVAAAAIYGAANARGESITQEEIASVAFVSIVTLSRQWQTIRSEVNINAQK